jgi:hypothetical protein
MAKEIDNVSDSWQNCSPGTLGRVVRRVTISKRRRNAFKTIAVIAPLLLLVALSFQFYATQDIGCGKASGMFTAYLDNQLTEPEQKQFDRHLAGCAKCTRALESLKESRSTVGVKVSSGVIHTQLLISKFCPQNLPAD